MFSLSKDDLQTLLTAAISAASIGQQARQEGSSSSQFGNGHGEDKLRPRDIGYFEPKNGELFTVKDNNHIYHNVYDFTNRMKVVAATTDTRKLLRVVNQCLLGEAQQWYNRELDNLCRLGLQSEGASIEDWTQALEARFKQARGAALKDLERCYYSVRELHRGKSPADFVQEVILLGQAAGIVTTEGAQIMLAYEHIDARLRANLQKPTDTTTMTDFLRDVNSTKHLWMRIYDYPRSDRDLARTLTNAGASTQDRPASLPYRGQRWQRPSRLGRYLVSGPSYGYSYSRNASSPRRRWNDQRPRDRNARFNGTTNRGHAGRPPWRGYGSRVHDAEADETAEAPNEYAKFQAWADEEWAYWQSRSVTDDGGESGKGPFETWTHENAEESSEGQPDANTMVVVSKLARCRDCKRKFPSNNRLHRHIRIGCDGRKPAGPRLIEDQESTGAVPVGNRPTEMKRVVGGGSMNTFMATDEPGIPPGETFVKPENDYRDTSAYRITKIVRRRQNRGPTSSLI